MNNKEFSTYKLFIYLAIGIFTIEFLIMLTLRSLALDDTIYVEFLDSLFLVIIVAPLVYLYAVKPLRAKINELKMSKVTVEEMIAHNEATEKDRAKDEALLASIGEGMIATDENGVITTVNRSTEKMLGWGSEELLGKIFTDAIRTVDEDGKEIPLDKCAMTNVISNCVPVNSEFIFYKRKNGSQIPVEATINPVVIDGKTIGTIQIFHDMTKENEIEKTRRDLLSLASHQLRTPLSGTKWLIETLKKGIHGTLTKNQEEYLDEIYKINEQMTTLVHDMLSVLRMEGDTTQAKKEHVSLSTLFSALFESLASVAKSKKVTLRLIKNGEDTIETDIILLRTILESIVSNAINYSPDKSEVVVIIEKNPTEFILGIKDSGIGIPKDEQRQVFERFYRASNAKTFDTHGTGLGLYIASMLAKKLGVRISFESEKGRGSTFYVHIPHTLPENTTRV